MRRTLLCFFGDVIRRKFLRLRQVSDCSCRRFCRRTHDHTADCLSSGKANPRFLIRNGIRKTKRRSFRNQPNIARPLSTASACGRVLEATVSAIWFGPAVASSTLPQAHANPSVWESLRQFNSTASSQCSYNCASCCFVSSNDCFVCLILGPSRCTAGFAKSTCSRCSSSS